MDAAVAACFATSAGEPTLTSLAGGGVMIFRAADTGETSVCDFFSDAPRLLPSEVDGLEFFHVDLDFGPATQRFYIGRGAAAVPGVLPGLCTALERWGTLSLGEVIAPACDMLRGGVPLGPYQGFAAKLLAPILTHTPKGRALFQPGGRVIGAQDRFALPQLANTLEAMAREGWRSYYARVLCPLMAAEFGPAAGGLLSPRDLDDYQVCFREPLSFRYRNTTVLTNPPPSAGGAMIGLMLRLLGTVDLGGLGPGELGYLRTLCQTMMVADAERDRAAELVGGAGWSAVRERFASLGDEPLGVGLASRPSPNNTTHGSVVDARGNAAAVTFSYGEGNGYFIGDSGIVMNNLMGEEDIHPHGFGSSPPGERLPSMMAPTLLVQDDGAVTAIGTGGANRIRTAMVQVISRLVDFAEQPEPAVAGPRLHFEKGVLNAEVFDRGDAAQGLESLGASQMVPFDEPNLFFGGVHLARRAADGQLEGVGDPRRGGVSRAV